jgi:hypothetical protein
MGFFATPRALSPIATTMHLRFVDKLAEPAIGKVLHPLGPYPGRAAPIPRGTARPIRFCRRLYLRANSRSMLKPPPAVTNAKTRPPIMARFL